jgi:dienelactone hydrolase
MEQCPRALTLQESREIAGVRRIWLAYAVLAIGLLVFGCTQSVRFPSASSQQRDMLVSSLYRPAGDGPFPALVLLHGCSGLGENALRWASWLKDEGYVALVVDSFYPRHISNICGPQGWMTLGVGDRVWDALGALTYLRSLPFVERDRIGVMGWSHGGATALRASGKRLQPPDGGFRVAVAFYPSCSGNLSNDSIPVLLLLGELDDWTPAEPCVEIAKRLSQEGAPVLWTVYPKAYHGFDVQRRGRVYLGHYLDYNPWATSDSEGRIRTFLAQYLRRVL